MGERNSISDGLAMQMPVDVCITLHCKQLLCLLLSYEIHFPNIPLPQHLDLAK